MKYVMCVSLLLALSACATKTTERPQPEIATVWTAAQHQTVEAVDLHSLQAWWKHFDDPVLNQLIDHMLSHSPDRNIAQARILEARGVRKTRRSSLFPQVGFSAEGSRQDFGFVGPSGFSDARFDASFELDVFGRHRKNLNAAEANILALENQYHDMSLSLIAEISRTYIEYRGFAKQSAIAQKNLQAQKDTLSLIVNRKRLGEATQLDVARAENLVNTTMASIPEFTRASDNARLQLSILTGELPEKLLSVLTASNDIPGANVEPVLLAPSAVLALRPDVRAASVNLSAQAALSQAATAELWPTFTLSGFFGATEGAFSTAKVWNIALGTAVNLLDFGRIEGRIDAAKARETIAYEQYRRTVLTAIVDVETALNDYGRIDEQRISLQNAFNNAGDALTLSQNLYQEGEISFLDVLDAQRTVNIADSSLVQSEVAQAESLIRLYKSLGVY